MRVLHVGKYFPPYTGGMETYLRDLMAAQQRQGMDTAALVHNSDIGLRSRFENFGADEQQPPVARAALWARLLFTPISPVFPWLQHRLIKRQGPDILHLHMPNVSAFWSLFLPGARRLPWVIHWHADVPKSTHHLGLRLFYFIYRPFQNALLRRSKAVIVTSPPYLESSEPLAPFRHKCHVIPLGLDPGYLQSHVGDRRDRDHLHVLAIGRLTYYKGLEYLIEATASVQNVQTHIVGSGELEPSLRKLSDKLGTGDRVTFHGQLTERELAEQYTECDCLCLPSIERTEAFGMVLLEAMCCGRATIIGNVRGSGMGWIVDEGVTGLYCDPENARSLADALSELAQDRDKLRRLGERGREKFERLFRIERSADAIYGLYRRVLDDRDENHHLNVHE